MTLLQMHVFLAIARTGSFTKAGETLNLTQSAVSQTLAGLEAEAGLTLFHRGKTGVTLTDAGTTLLPYAREMLRSEERFGQAAASLKGLQTGSLTIGCFPSFMAGHMPELIKGFRDRYPGLSVAFREGNYDEIHGWLLDGTVDVGFNVYAKPPLRFIPLMDDPMRVVMPKDHPFAKRKEVSVDELLSEPFVRDTGCEHYLAQLFPDPSRQPNDQFGVRDTFAILSMVQAGLGITVLPRMSVPAKGFDVRTCELKPRLVRTIGLSLHARRALSPGAEALIRHVAESFKNAG
ncbi:LysR family transcriptional regulator [Cohnella caldifontis]|uniref:LysR family transcriptional regulator n=1 Tax=Cohnella caldifontis TaxID=3027471 RepID=UPI0023EE0409|nr:LysR family transcriptional regulator [Cohnella sp. YIM B05605]